MIFGQTVLITFEGLDGSGKTTLMNAVTRKLKELGETQFDTIREPSEETYIKGFNPRQILKEDNIDPYTEIFIVNAYRRENVVKFIKPKLDSNISVIQDRFLLSTYAYNVYPFQDSDPDIADLYVGSMPFVIGQDLPEPITFLIDTDKETRLNRLENTRATMDRYEMDEAYQNKVTEAYSQLSQSPSVVIVDGELELSKQVEFVINVLKEHAERKTKELESIKEELNETIEDSESNDVVETTSETDVETPFDLNESLNGLVDNVVHELNQIALGQGDELTFDESKELIFNIVNETIKVAGDPTEIMSNKANHEAIKSQIIPMVYYGTKFNNLVDKYA